MNNETIIEFLLQNDETFDKYDNVYYAEKAFVIKSIVDWCTKKSNTGELKDSQVQSYISLIRQYLKGEIILFWTDDDQLGYTVIKKKGNQENDQ